MPGLVTRLRQLFGRAPELRHDIGPMVGFGLGPILSNNLTNARVAENVSAVVACVNCIAGTIATLPPRVYRSTDTGRVEVRDHPVARLLRHPNDRQTWPDLCEMWLASALLHGNGLASIDFDGAGRPTRMVAIPWQFVLPQLLSTGRMVFDVQNIVLPWGGTGSPRRFLENEVLLLKDRSDDGYLGRSRLSRAHEALGAALGIQQFSSSIWANVATPAGVLQTDHKLTKEARDQLTFQWNEVYAGARNARKTVVLEQGLKFEAMSVSPEDAEVLESRRFTVEEMARIFGVPPPVIQDYTHGTFTNTAQAATWFAQLTLTPWVRKIEAEFSRALFNDPAMHLEIDLSALMRGDFAARWAAAQIAVQNGILTPNEIREQEGYNPLPDGDALHVMPGSPAPGDRQPKVIPEPAT